MKKNLMLLFSAMIAVLHINAALLTTSLVATLTHDGQATQFYGASALQEAHEAAVSGDIITLTGGTFNPCTITKGITLRGSCMGTTLEMESQGMRPTIINAEMRVQVPHIETNILKIEDMYFNNVLYVDSVPHITFARVKTRTRLHTTENINNFDAIQCSFHQIYPKKTSAATVYSFVNSAIAFVGYYSSYYSDQTTSFPYHVNADHCVIGALCAASNGQGNYPHDGVFNNCIFTATTIYSSEMELPPNCTANYCVAVESNFFRQCIADDCQTTSMAELFGDQENTYYQEGGYIKPLTEEAAATYLGTDGTQVGIYGGTLTFSLLPDNPVVTRCDIARKTNEEGKLKVEIEVKRAE